MTLDRAEAKPARRKRRRRRTRSGFAGHPEAVHVGHAIVRSTLRHDGHITADFDRGGQFFEQPDRATVRVIDDQCPVLHAHRPTRPLLDPPLRQRWIESDFARSRRTRASGRCERNAAVVNVGERQAPQKNPKPVSEAYTHPPSLSSETDRTTAVPFKRLAHAFIAGERCASNCTRNSHSRSWSSCSAAAIVSASLSPRCVCVISAFCL